MKTSVVMDFKVDRDTKTIHVTREFAAPVSKVWAAWTEKQLLDQWWAPKPWVAKTKSMNFSEGGYWLYAMVGPEGTQDWCRCDYQTIQTMKSFSVKSSFCDEKGNITNTFPIAFWKNEFFDSSSSTLVNIEISFDELSGLDKYIEMGFKEGFTAALENLDQLLG